jgi:hypothetical protein
MVEVLGNIRLCRFQSRRPHPPISCNVGSFAGSSEREHCQIVHVGRNLMSKHRRLLLHHKFRRLCLEALLPQQGHRGRVLMSALIKRKRMVAIEFGMWRSGRKGGSPGSITVG